MKRQTNSLRGPPAWRWLFAVVFACSTTGLVTAQNSAALDLSQPLEQLVGDARYITEIIIFVRLDNGTINLAKQNAYNESLFLDRPRTLPSNMLALQQQPSAPANAPLLTRRISDYCFEEPPIERPIDKDQAVEPPATDPDSKTPQSADYASNDYLLLNEHLVSLSVPPNPIARLAYAQPPTNLTTNLQLREQITAQPSNLPEPLQNSVTALRSDVPAPTLGRAPIDPTGTAVPENTARLGVSAYVALAEGVSERRAEIRNNAFQLGPAANFSLAREARRINAQPDLQVIEHIRWQQEVPEREAPLPIYIRNESFGLHGVLNVTLGRYLHLSANLWIDSTTARVGDSIGAFDQTLLTRANSMLTPGRNVQQRYAGYRYIELSESRRMRSGETHYLDHPTLGVLVRITPVETPQNLSDLWDELQDLSLDDWPS